MSTNTPSQTAATSLINIPKTPLQVQNFCDGQFFSGLGAEIEVRSPYTNEKIGVLKSTTKSDLEKAMPAIKKAQSAWAATPLKERCQFMFSLRNILIRDIDKISHRISSECGKTLTEARAEIHKGVEVIEYASSLQNSDVGGRLEVSRGVFCEYRREALGVVASITPFNFPAMVPLWTLPITITLGNALLWKPSDKTPLTSMLIAEAMKEAGLPSGILNIFQGGRETVEAILEHPDVGAISFVGSTGVAKHVYEFGTKHMKRVLALGGAKNHILLLPDADLELSGKGIADSFTGCAGQRCMAASVLCAIEGEAATAKTPNSRIETLILAIKTQASRMELGRDMGAIISKESLAKLNKAIDQAQKDGAVLLLDGRKQKSPVGYEGGNWLGPTILDHVKPGSEAATEELFGPVLSIVRCKSVDEALAIQSKSPYGNAISVFTQNGAIAEEVARRGQAGMVGINIGVPVPREPFSFGGTFESKFGHGDITGAHSLDFWSNIKKVTTKWAAQKDWNWMS